MNVFFIFFVGLLFYLSLNSLEIEIFGTIFSDYHMLMYKWGPSLTTRKAIKLEPACKSLSLHISWPWLVQDPLRLSPHILCLLLLSRASPPNRFIATFSVIQRLILHFLIVFAGKRCQNMLVAPPLVLAFQRQAKLHNHKLIRWCSGLLLARLLKSSNTWSRKKKQNEKRQEQKDLAIRRRRRLTN